MKLNRITIEQLCSLGRAKVLDYNGRLMISDHIAQEYLFEEPCRIDAITILICLRGQLDYEVNLERFTVSGSNIIINTPENIIQLRSSENLEAYAVLISSDLIKSMPYDILHRATAYLPVKKHFHAPVPLEELATLIPFYNLINASLAHTTPETDEIVRSLLQAFLLNIVSLLREHQMGELEVDRNAPQAAQLLFERFMEALSKYHQQERMVQFYADKLCVTPKYLSTVIKEYSGKTASDWICEYVIAEAKSLLHYSQLPVQEVAYRLNFPSQSAFCKFFKQNVGCTPKQYGKSDLEKYEND